jgi:hypothetical protein
MSLDRKGWHYKVGEHYGLIWLTALRINYIKSFFCDSKHNAKFHNLRTTPSRRKIAQGEEREKERKRKNTVNIARTKNTFLSAV